MNPIPYTVQHDELPEQLSSALLMGVRIILRISCKCRTCRELCNECHTSDNYEVNAGIVPGSLLYHWQVQQAAFLKHTIGVKQVRCGTPLSIVLYRHSTDTSDTPLIVNIRECMNIHPFGMSDSEHRFSDYFADHFAQALAWRIRLEFYVALLQLYVISSAENRLKVLMPSTLT